MTEPAARPSGPGTVVMDVGGDIGALILYTTAELVGREIEISLDDAPAARRTHALVRARHMTDATEYADRPSREMMRSGIHGRISVRARGAMGAFTGSG